MTSTAADPLLNPRSIALVGSSPTSAWGAQLVENHQRLGFAGQLAVVNSTGADVHAVPGHRSLTELTDVPDLVQILVGTDRVLQVVEQAAELGVRAAVVYATGFAEAGGEGRELQRRLVKVASQAGMRLVGPNGLGILSFVHNCSSFLDVVHPTPPGRVGLLSQSGQVAISLVNNRLGVRFSHVISGGNEAVTDCADYLQLLVDDPHTDVIVAFLETIRRPECFFAACDAAQSAGKPVVVFKVGRSEASQQMAVAHSGALSSPDRLVNARFERHGIVRVGSPDELLQAALALSSPLPRGGNIASISFSGGQLEMILDEAARFPVLRHPQLHPDTVAKLRRYVPTSMPVGNPLDYWGVPDYQENFAHLIAALATDPGIDVVVGIADANQTVAGLAGREKFALDGAIHARAVSGKPVVMLSTLAGSPPPDAVQNMADHGVLWASGIGAGFTALDAAVRVARRATAPPVGVDLDTDAVERAFLEIGPSAQSGAAAMRLLSAAGIRTVQTVEVASSEEAMSVATRLGLPVAVKIGDADVLHKTELGGVALDLRDGAAVRAAAARMFAAGSQSVLVQPYLTGGVELLVGFQRDAQLGGFVLAGMGGIWTEILEDVAIRPSGLRHGDAPSMLSGLRAAAVLHGARGAHPIDLDAVSALIERFDALTSHLGERVDAIDVNPILATPTGAWALDALVVPAGATGGSGATSTASAQ